jgi:hypothetical protein
MQQVKNIPVKADQLARSASLKVIETERLILRTWRDSDLRPFSLMNQDPLGVCPSNAML